jgi:hypothetical protein
MLHQLRVGSMALLIFARLAHVYSQLALADINWPWLRGLAIRMTKLCSIFRRLSRHIDMAKEGEFAIRNRQELLRPKLGVVIHSPPPHSIGKSKPYNQMTLDQTQCQGIIPHPQWKGTEVKWQMSGIDKNGELRSVI